MRMDRNGLEPMGRAECLLAARSRSIGRVAVTVDALPAIFPVNFAFLDDDVLFRTSTGTKLAAAVRGSVVAFEVDDADAMSHTGWSVLIVGRAETLTRPDELARARTVPLQPWAPGDRGHFVRIRSELVSGRRLTTEARARFAAPTFS